LFAQPAAAGLDLGRTPALLMQKFPARRFAVETRMAFQPCGTGAFAGLAVVGGGEHAALAHDGEACVLLLNGRPAAAVAAPAGLLRLRVEVDESATCRFSWAADAGPFTELQPAFQAKHGGWMGAKVGLFCLNAVADALSACADFDYVRFQP
jgi:hypothetical protein